MRKLTKQKKINIHIWDNEREKRIMVVQGILRIDTAKNLNM